jgi:arylsulfatase A-like enzyme
MDLYATALSLAGVTGLADDIDSIDLSPVFEGKPSPRDDLEYFGTKGQFLAYRKGAWKVSFTEDGVTLSNKAELYNLQHDPAEMVDVSKVYPNVFKDLVTEAKKRDAAIPRAAPIFDQT